MIIFLHLLPIDVLLEDNLFKNFMITFRKTLFDNYDTNKKDFIIYLGGAFAKDKIWMSEAYCEYINYCTKNQFNIVFSGFNLNKTVYKTMKSFCSKIINFTCHADLLLDKSTVLYEHLKEHNNFELASENVEFISILYPFFNLNKNKIKQQTFFTQKGGFSSMSILILTNLIALEFSKFIKHKSEIIIDPCFHTMSSFNEEFTTLYGHQSDILQAKECYFAEHYYSKRKTKEKKIYNLVAGYTILSEPRLYLQAIAKNEIWKKDENKLFVKDSFLEVDTTLSKDQYEQFVKKSKFCLVFNSYDTRFISWLRVCEVLAAGTIPIFILTEDQEINNLAINSWIGDRSLIEKFITTVDKIDDKIEELKKEDYAKLLEYLNNLVFNKPKQTEELWT